MSNTFSSIELDQLQAVVGGQSECPDAAEIYAMRAAVGAVDTAARMGQAAQAAGRGDLLGVIGNTAGAAINGAATVKGLLTPPDTPTSCNGLQ